MKDWEELLVDPELSIFKVIEVIDCSGVQIALVVDENRHLLGVITDGDIRRALIKRLDLAEPAKSVMNVHPETVSLTDSDQQIISKMKALTLRHLPVVDAKGQVVDLKMLDTLLKKEKHENYVVLMAGGLGKRLGELTTHCPKPLLRLGNKPILQTIIESFEQSGFYKFFISLNYKAQMIEQHFGNGDALNIQIDYLKEDKKLGTAGALSLLPEKIDEPIIVMNADLLTKVNFQSLLDFHHSHNADATMCVTEYDFQVPFGVVQTNEVEIATLDEKPIHRCLVNAGIYVLNPDILKLIPKNKNYQMTDLFNEVIKRKLKAVTFPIREYWLDIGCPEDFVRADAEYRDFFYD